MNELYQSTYGEGIYTPIYLPPIVFYDESEEDTSTDYPEAKA